MDVDRSNLAKLVAGLPPQTRVPLSAQDEAGRVAEHVVQTARARMTDATFEARMAGFDAQGAAAVVDPRSDTHARMLEDMRAMAGDPELQRDAQGFAARAGAMMADPGVEARAALMASRVRALVTAPGFLGEAKRAESEVHSLLAQLPHGPRSALATKFFAFSPLLPARTASGLQSAEAAVQPARPGGQAPLPAGRAALRRSTVVMAASGGDTPGEGKDPKGDEAAKTDTKRMMQQIKDSGIAGIISYALWEGAFWGVSVPVCITGYYKVTGHLPDLSNGDDVKQLGAEAFAFVNVARLAVPARVGLALGTTPWVKANIVEKFGIGSANETAAAAEPATGTEPEGKRKLEERAAEEPTEAKNSSVIAQKPAEETRAEGPSSSAEEGARGTQPSPEAKLELPDAKLNAVAANQEQWGIGGAQEEKPAEEKPAGEEPAKEEPAEEKPAEEAATWEPKRVRKRDIVRKVLFPWNWNKTLSELNQ